MLVVETSDSISFVANSGDSDVLACDGRLSLVVHPRIDREARPVFGDQIMRRFCETLKCLGTIGVLCLGLLLTADVVFAQPGGQRGGGGPGGSRGGRGGFFGNGEPSLSRELRTDSFAEKMNLTEQQKETLSEIDMQRMEYFRASFQGGRGQGGDRSPEETEKRNQEVQAKMKEFETLQMAVLTVEQKAIWEDRKKEVKAAQEANPNSRPDGNRSRSDSGSNSSSITQPSTRRTVFSDEKPPEGVAPTASFAARPVAGPLETTIADDGTGVAVGAKAPNGEATLSFNFRYAPWAEVLKLFAEAAQWTLDLNEVPPGTFNYYDDKTYTVTEALDVLNGYLLPKGYALVRRDRFLVALNIDNGIPPGLLPTITVDELAKRGVNELLIVDVPLEGFEVDKIVGEVKELLSPWGKIAAMKQTNSLNILDTGSNISRIIRLLKAGTPVGNAETAFRAISLKHITAADAERTVRRLFGLNPAVTSSSPQFGMGFGGNPQFGGFGGGFGGFGGFRGGDDRGRGGDDRNRDQQQQQRPQPSVATPSAPSPFAGKIQVTADTRTNHLLVTASASLVKVVEDAVKSIDVDTGKPPVETGPAYLKAYTVAGGDVTQVAQTLNSMLPGLVVGVDTRSSKIHVQGNGEEHTQIERLIQTLAGDINGGSVAVINLTRSDPVQVTNTLRNLFATEVKAPTIEADSLGRRLLIRGSAEQLAQVKSLLTSLGESGADPNSDAMKASRGNVRMLNPQGRDPQDVLPLMRQMWDAADRAPIRVVVPSQPNPVRERRVPGGRSFDVQNPANTNRPPEVPRPTSRPAGSLDRTGPSTQTAPRRSSILQVSQSGAREDEATPKSVGTSQTGDSVEPPAGAKPEVLPKRADAAPAASDKSPISLSIVGGELVITGDNPEALDQFEEMFNTLISALPVRTQWTVFYLRSADATDTAQMLERLFPQSSVTASTSSSGGMFGSLTGGLSNLGRGMMNVTGLNQTLGGGNSLRIITDIRSNALFVSGPKDQIAEIESMLELLDSAELPTSLRDRVPREIAVEHADVEEVAAIIEDVFKDALTPENQQQQGGGGGQRFNPLAMLMGGGGGGGNGGRKEPGVQLTVGVDRRTSHLIISCNDNLFRQIEGLVTSIDERARDARQTVQIMRLETADPTVVSSTLVSLIPKVTVSASRATRRKPSEQPGQPQGQPGGGQQGDGELMRRMMERNRQQGGGQNSGGGQRPNAGGGGTGRTNGGAGAGGGGGRQGGGGARPNTGGGNGGARRAN
ncbi:MAG: NolW domain protein [Schlesneria sp.]|nr:NolW domain protein [Schlesneria sp.]